MKAVELLRRRLILAEDAFAEVVVWRVEESVPPWVHRFKYRLAYVVAGECVLRYDNERGKGDHWHWGQLETPYRFSTPSQLLADFNAQIARWNDENGRSEVRSAAETVASMAKTMEAGQPEAEARISFATPELLWQVLTAKRWELLKAFCGAGSVSIREAARRVGRDVKAVHGDVTAILNAGALDRADGGIRFPFDAVKVEFLIQAA